MARLLSAGSEIHAQHLHGSAMLSASARMLALERGFV
jgi:hypothetical protein